jgi:8-oxo-dGTP pyrophosphatase MutT (NUDIX family)
MRKLAHQTLGVQKQALVGEVFRDFNEGDRVMTRDGYPGRVTAVLDGPYPQTETYEVTLDRGVGGGQYSASQLSKMAETTAARIQDVVLPADLGPIEATTYHQATEDYPELGAILDERPPNERVRVFASKPRPTKAFPYGHRNGAEITDPEYPGESGLVRCDNCGKYHSATYDHEGRFGEGRIHAVVCPEDHLTDYYTDERLEPRQASTHTRELGDEDLEREEDPHASSEQDRTDKIDKYEEKAVPAIEPIDPPSACSFCGSDQFEDPTNTGRGTRMRCSQCGGTMTSWGGQWQPDPPNTPANAASREGDYRSTINNLDAVHAAISPEDMIRNAETMYGTDRKHWSDAALRKATEHGDETSRGELEQRKTGSYTPEQFGENVLARYDLLRTGDPQAAAVASDPHSDPVSYLAGLDADFGFHMCATWADVRRKAKRIKDEGGVRIVAASHEGIVGEVQGEHHLYESSFTYVPGRKAIAAWDCGCKWGAYAWGRAPAYARFEGRQCSHVTALQFEAQSRGMFGATVQPNEERLEGQHPHSPVTVEYQRPTDRNEGGNRNRRTTPPGNMRTEWTPGSRVRIKGSLDEYGIPTVQGSNFGTDDLAPVHVFALQMVAAHDEADAILRMLAGYGVAPEQGLGIIAWAASKKDEPEGEATTDPMGGQAAPGTDIPRLEDRDQTDAKHKRKHILHHTNDARQHAPNFGYGIGHGIGPLIWCDQCNGSGCGHCGGTGQVVAPNNDPTGNMGPGDASLTSAPIADQSPDAGEAVSGDGLSATGAREYPCECCQGKGEHSCGHECYACDASGHQREQHSELCDPQNHHDDIDGDWKDDVAPNRRDDVGMAPTASLQMHEWLQRRYADYTADSFMTGGPAQTYQQSTPTSNSANPASTGWATSADPADWEQPIIGHDFGIADHYGSLPSDTSGSTPPVVSTAAGEALPSTVGFDLGVLDGVFVPGGAVGLSSVQGGQTASSEDIRTASARQEVVEAYARAVNAGLATWTVDRSVMALVVDDVARRYLASQQHENQSVRLPDLPLPVHVAVAAAALGARPEMARIAGAEGDAGKKPKWDPPTVSGVALKAHDTGRVLMIQRSNKDESDPAKGTWEMPGGHHEEGDQTSLHAGIREWEEETGHPFPEGGHVSHTWRSGPYQGHVVVIPKEEAVDFSNGRATTNPDDPDGDDHEQSAWWEIEHAKKNPALRPELKDANPWSGIAKAAAYLTADEVRAVARAEEERTGKTSEQLLREHVARQEDAMQQVQLTNPGGGAPIETYKLSTTYNLATLHNEPEPALPSTDGADQDGDGISNAANDLAPGTILSAQPQTPWGYAPGDPDLLQGGAPPAPQMAADEYEGDAAHDSLSDDETNNLPFRSEGALDVPLEQLVSAFQATAGGRSIVADAKTPKGKSGAKGGDISDSDIAAAAREVLAKTGSKDFSFSEQQELINEGGSKTRARNFDDLKIEGTHYARLGDEIVDDDEFLFL